MTGPVRFGQPAPATESLRRYFTERYPRRGAGGAARWFRAGEEERRAVVAPWLDGAGGARLLDVGCGDGVFLASALAARPAELWLVDLSAGAVAGARARLAARADSSHALAGDVHELDLPAADVVVAFGVTDYWSDWNRLLGRLCQLATREVIVDFPRALATWGAVRRVWLWRHRVPLHTARRAEVEAVTRGRGAVELVATARHWLARIRVARGPARRPAHDPAA